MPDLGIEPSVPQAEALQASCYTSSCPALWQRPNSFTWTTATAALVLPVPLHYQTGFHSGE